MATGSALAFQRIISYRAYVYTRRLSSALPKPELDRRFADQSSACTLYMFFVARRAGRTRALDASDYYCSYSVGSSATLIAIYSLEFETLPLQLIPLSRTIRSLLTLNALSVPYSVISDGFS